MLGGKRHLKGRKQSNDVSASRKTWLPADVGDVDAFPSLFFVFSFFVSWSQQSLETIKKTGSKKKGRGESHSIQAISKEVRKVRRFGAQMKFLRMAIMTRCVFFFVFLLHCGTNVFPEMAGRAGTAPAPSEVRHGPIMARAAPPARARMCRSAAAL